LRVITSQTWTKPANLAYVVVETVGSGAGGDGTSGDSGESGGGAGGYSRKIIQASSLSATETVFVSPGGFGGLGAFSLIRDGQGGGVSTFGSFIVSSGGNYNFGGTSIGGDINIVGGDGQGGVGNSTIAFGGNGGASIFGGGGHGVNSGNGSNGLAYGSGGGGGSEDNSTDADGGAGAPGVVIVTNYF